MQNNKKTMYQVVTMAIVVVAMLAWQSQANRKQAPSTPIVLVSVYFERVFEGLEERAFEKSRVEALIESFNEELIKKRQNIDNYDQEFEFLEKDSKEWNELAQKQQLEMFEFLAQTEYNNARAEREESKSMLRVYEHIREASAALSKRHGWDYVFVNDAIVPFPDGVFDVASQISSRRMLYANPVLDITDTLIEYMNASFDEMAVR